MQTLKLITSDPHDAPARFVEEEMWEPTMPQRLPFTDISVLSHEEWTARGCPSTLTA